MTRPNMFIVYVADAPASARFYADLFDMTPSFETPGFVAFDLDGGVQLALWSGAQDGAARRHARTSEVCLTLSGGPGVIDRWFRTWSEKDIEVVVAPRDEVFGRTFVVADPDGNLIRVAPVD